MLDRFTFWSNKDWDWYKKTFLLLKQAKDLITIPPLAEETWRIAMMTPEQQLVNPFFMQAKSLQFLTLLMRWTTMQG